MKRYVTYAVVITGLAGLGGWAYYTQHAPARPALEIGATSSTAAKAPVSAQGSGSAPAGSGTAPAAGGAGGSRPAGGAAGGGRGPVGVEAERAQSMAITEEVFAVGNLRANESVTIRPEIAGRVVRIGFTEGALVRKGDLLVELDRSVLLAQVEQARAELDLSKANYDRTADLAERKFVSESARDHTGGCSATCGRTAAAFCSGCFLARSLAWPMARSSCSSAWCCRRFFPVARRRR